MRIGSLFSGIGGIELGFHRQGFQTVWFVEKEPFCQKVLRKNFGEISIYDDIKSFNATLLQEGFRARTFQMLAREQALKEHAQVFGKICWKPFAWFDQSTQSWKTFQISVTGGWVQFSETWPKQGMMRNGIAYRPESSALRTKESESLLLPTPTANEHKYALKRDSHRTKYLAALARKGLLPTPTTSTTGSNARKAFMKRTGMKYGQLNPCLVEWMMGFPMGYTDLDLSETPLSPNVQNSSQ